MLPRNDRLGMDLFHYFIRLDTYGRATEEQLSSKGNTLRWNEFWIRKANTLRRRRCIFDATCYIDRIPVHVSLIKILLDFVFIFLV